MLVVDASLIVEAALTRLEANAMKALDADDMVAPWLLWSEVPSALNELVYRHDIPADIGEKAIERRYDRRADIHEAFLTISAALICHQQLHHSLC